MAKVFVVNQGGHDYSPAAKFGEIVYCTHGQLSKYDTGSMFRELTAAMQDSDEEDYILLTSLTTLCSVAAALFAYKHGRVNLLIYKDNDYLERKVVFDDV